MKKSLVVCAFATIVVASSLAETNKTHHPLTQEQRIALQRKAWMRKNGGFVKEEGSAKGTFVILNAQKDVSGEMLKNVQKQMDNMLLIQHKIVDESDVNIGNISEKIRSVGGTVGVAVVKDDSLPSLLTAPESKWAIVNVSKIAEGCKDKDVIASRVRKEILRSMAFITGCCYMTKADPLMRDVVSPRDLDGLFSEDFGLEIVSHFLQSAPLYGLKPWHKATYRKACEEGWAPAPTNDVQKAIWDKVHQLPSEPIKIKPETKKVAE